MLVVRQALEGLMPLRGIGDAHPGLLLQRYLHKAASGDNGEPKEKRAILDAAISSKRCDMYEAAFERWQKSLPALTVANDLQTLGRLIVGLGTESVLETGIRLHHTYGTPVIPGSALKGLAAHYCHDLLGEKFKRGTDSYAILFGKTKDRGCIIFHDAWLDPESLNPLKLDVLTPHHPHWLDGSVAPSDFDSPIPIPFLSVAGKFHVAVSWCGPAHDEAEKWTKFAMECLRDALCEWGIGGKTSSGYGLFDLEKWKQEEEKQKVDAERKRLQDDEEATLAAMSPIERSVNEFLEQHPNKAELRDWFKLYEELKKPDSIFNDTQDRKYVAIRVRIRMQEAKVWKDKGKDGERKKFVEAILDDSY